MPDDVTGAAVAVVVVLVLGVVGLMLASLSPSHADAAIARSITPPVRSSRRTSVERCIVIIVAG
jgi:hypothetical protein